MTMKAIVQAGALALCLGLAAPAMACELSRPLKMAGLDYDSAGSTPPSPAPSSSMAMAARSSASPASSPLINGLARGDADIIMEIWTANPAEAWVEAEKAGQVVPLGTTFPDAVEGWFVPTTLVSGPNAEGSGPEIGLRPAESVQGAVRRSRGARQGTLL